MLDDFKLWYLGDQSGRGGVDIVVDKDLKNNVVDVKRVGDKIISLKLVLDKEVVNIISVYVPQAGLDESYKLQFWEHMDELMHNFRSVEKIIMGGDLNGHIGKDRRDYVEVHGGFGVGERNEEGTSVLDFVVTYDLSIANMLFTKREEHLITYKSGQHASQIDFFLTKRHDKWMCKACKVIPGESLTSQHKLLILDMCFNLPKKKTRNQVCLKVRWCRLKGESVGCFRDKMVKHEKWDREGDANMMWNVMIKCIEKVAKEVLGVAKGTKLAPRET
ncbi:craniofacial development protein 2-like [Macadamia integrifolia]|uniref:craniofacial development protein 2-like n=1 Tax=Macadamia integrifolia TaxID=60698 RepID=UPI001C4E789B|nr:craniofacial development protein 2-like [Macadamia integrifolia]